MSHAIATVDSERKPAGWLVAGGIACAVALSISCLAILAR
jgi:hypothetical protein